ncbi:MAG: hypothetical protein A49_02620 [Methyloceanibacter sp.]|nr:MAG: hypothetical protein A49_02620 [Methyloceanibacter sp.]
MSCKKSRKLRDVPHRFPHRPLSARCAWNNGTIEIEDAKRRYGVMDIELDTDGKIVLMPAHEARRPLRRQKDVAGEADCGPPRFVLRSPHRNSGSKLGIETRD